MNEQYTIVSIGPATKVRLIFSTPKSENWLAGGKPSKATPADRRLKENKNRPPAAQPKAGTVNKKSK